MSSDAPARPLRRRKPLLTALPALAVRLPAPNWPALGVALAALLAANLPRLLGYWTAGPDRVFMGAVWGEYDMPNYVGALMDGVRGSWLCDCRTVPGDHPAYLWVGPYVLTGHLVAPLVTGFGWSPERAVELMRWVADPICLAACWLYVRASLPARLRVVAYFFALLAGGIGWLFLTRPVTPLGRVTPLDVVAPSFTVANGFQMAPHVALATAGIAVYAWGLVAAAQGRRRGLWGAPALAAVASFHGFLVPMALAAGTLFVLWQARHRTALAMLLLSAATSLPFVAYLAWTALSDPTIHSASQELLTDTIIQNLPSLLVSRIWLWPLVALGAWRALRGGAAARLALCWSAVALALDLAPVSNTSELHRTVEGLSLPLAVLAAGALPGWNRLCAYLCALACISPVLQFGLIAEYGRLDRNVSLARSDYQLATTFREQGRQGVLLASPRSERWFVALTRLRAAPAGDNFDQPSDWTIAELPKLPPGDRAEWLRERADLLFWGASERAVLGPPPEGLAIAAASGPSLVLKPG